MFAKMHTTTAVGAESKGSEQDRFEFIPLSSAVVSSERLLHRQPCLVRYNRWSDAVWQFDPFFSRSLAILSVDSRCSPSPLFSLVSGILENVVDRRLAPVTPSAPS